MTETTSEATAPAESLSIEDAVAERRGESPKPRPKPDNAFKSSHSGLQEAAKDLQRRREEPQDPEFAEELARAWFEAAWSRPMCSICCLMVHPWRTSPRGRRIKFAHEMGRKYLDWAPMYVALESAMQEKGSKTND